MKLLATIIKDWRLLLRDRVGLALLFGMPVLLVLIVTSIQNNVFAPTTTGRLLLLVQNKDTGRFSRELLITLRKTGIYRATELPRGLEQRDLQAAMKERSAAIGMIIPADFSARLGALAARSTAKALRSFGLDEGNARPAGASVDSAEAVGLLFHPGIDAATKVSVAEALNGALQAIQSREVLKQLYFSINNKDLGDSLENDMLSDHLAVREIPTGGAGSIVPLNATQHNVPAWTVFAMFFVVMSLGGSVVKEKTTGSYIRLKTLPTSFFTALASKQLVYLAVTFLQALVIFGLGVWFFPVLGLPALRLPGDLTGLILVTLLCGSCAVSYALFVGVLARTQEQSNGFGAISIVILSILGGLMVPAFIMPEGFKNIMRFSPLHWALESYSGLFLEGGKWQDILINIVPLAVITLLLQLIVLVALKRKRLI